MTVSNQLVSDHGHQEQDIRLSVKQLAERENVTTKTIANWDAAGLGPKRMKLAGNVIRYKLTDVQAWEEAQYNGGAV